MNKTALITGITGQDGFYLTELLSKKKYHIVGFSRQPRPPHLPESIEWIVGDLRDEQTLYQTLKKTQPHEIYHLASQSYPGHSWELARETTEINALGAHQLFECVRQLGLHSRIYQASSSDMYGDIATTPQNENTPFSPNNPYAVAKLYAHHMAKIYRQTYHLFISCGILFNHESPKRGMHFVTQKVTYAAACIKAGIHTSLLLNEKGEPIINNGKLSIGNLDTKRDWGYAGDYVEAMWLMLQQDRPDDFVIGTGITRTIRELCQTAFSYVGLNWENHVEVDSRFIRPIETGPTVADARKAREQLGWSPKLSFEACIASMVENHLTQIVDQMP